MSDNEMKHVNDEKLAQASGGASQPGRQKIGYTVKRGDTLIKIANYWGVSVLDQIGRAHV